MNKRKIFKSLAVFGIAVLCSISCVGCSLGGAEISQEDLDKTIDVIQSVDEKYQDLIDELKEQTEIYESIKNNYNTLTKEEAYNLCLLSTNKILLNYNNVLDNLKIEIKQTEGLGNTTVSDTYTYNYFKTQDYSLVCLYSEDNEGKHVSFKNGNKYIDSWYSRTPLNAVSGSGSAYIGEEYDYSIRESFEDAAYRESEFSMLTTIYDSDLISNVELLENGNYKITFTASDIINEEEIVIISDYEISQDGKLIKVDTYKLTDWINFESVSTEYKYGGVSDSEIENCCQIIEEILEYKEYVDSQN